jgi:hypothetical protein
MRETRRKGSRRCGGCGWAIKHARRVIGRVRTTDDALDANLHSLHDDGQFTPRPPAYRHRVLIRRISPIAYRNPFTEHTASSAHVARPDCTCPRCRPASLRDCPHDRRLTRTVTNNSALVAILPRRFAAPVCHVRPISPWSGTHGCARWLQPVLFRHERLPAARHGEAADIHRTHHHHNNNIAVALAR